MGLLPSFTHTVTMLDPDNTGRNSELSRSFPVILPFFLRLSLLCIIFPITVKQKYNFPSVDFFLRYYSSRSVLFITNSVQILHKEIQQQLSQSSFVYRNLVQSNIMSLRISGISRHVASKGKISIQQEQCTDFS